MLFDEIREWLNPRWFWEQTKPALLGIHASLSLGVINPWKGAYLYPYEVFNFNYLYKVHLLNSDDVSIEYNVPINLPSKDILFYKCFFDNKKPLDWYFFRVNEIIENFDEFIQYHSKQEKLFIQMFDENDLYQKELKDIFQGFY